MATKRTASRDTGEPSARPTLFDALDRTEMDASENKYCRRDVLSNEASVEQFFVSRLLKDLGYTDAEIKPKETLAEISVARGRKKEMYRPDYALVCNDVPRWIVDAKTPSERVDDFAYQGAGYAFGLNQGFSNDNPCRYYVITNGYVFKVWKWDEAQPVLELSFADFLDDNQRFLELRSLLGAKVARKGWERKAGPRPAMTRLTKPSVQEVKRIFSACHQLIWKTEKMSPQPAFFEFVKVMFVKLFEDRKLHEDVTLGPLVRAGQPIPAERIVFSTRWVATMQEQRVTNPIDSVLFHRLAEDLKEAVALGKKKPIFEGDEHINLHPSTIAQVVAKLERYDLFGIDEDLNGRLFETFLSATMRGEALGQYFTPRSIVKLMEHLTAPEATRTNVDRVLDACCGTGGFLIEVLTTMRNQIRHNASLTALEATNLQEKVANESIYGIDAGREPPLAQIARINMYLHGDGGSRIYSADSLDKTVQTGVQDTPQTKRELEELRALLLGIERGRIDGFDIVLTNPPFAMDYSDRLDNERAILAQYDLAEVDAGQTSKRRSGLRSSIMFIERYADLLKPGGKLVTVIDDSILSGPKYAFARDFIRKRYIVRAVVSLPGDAFQRVGARAKTSVLYLVRRDEDDASQPDVFMMECQYVGLDDVPTKTRASKAAEARTRAESEIRDVTDAFRAFMDGKSGPWRVSADHILGRLDVKACLPRADNIVAQWRAEGREVARLDRLMDHIEYEGFIPQDEPERAYALLQVRYDGVAQEGETALGGELTYRYVQHPKVDDVVVSNIAAALGSIGVIPKELEHTVASSEFTIMRVKAEAEREHYINPWYLWGYMRSPEVLARLVSGATGTNRHRVRWDVLQKVPVPILPREQQDKIGEQFRASVESVRAAEKARASEAQKLNALLSLDNPWALQRMRAAKPPK